MRFVRDNSLVDLLPGASSSASLVGQAIAGHAAFNHDQLAHGEPRSRSGATSRPRTSRPTSPENWQSEYLQFLLFILGTVWLRAARLAGVQAARPGGPRVRRGPAGRRRTRAPTRRAWARAGGLRTRAVLQLAADRDGRICLRLAGWRSRSPAVAATTPSSSTTTRPTVSWLGYLGSADFWSATLQNWQSEFLAVGSMAVLCDLPAPARLAGVQARRRPPRRHRASRAERLGLRARRKASIRSSARVRFAWEFA